MAVLYVLLLAVVLGGAYVLSKKMAAKRLRELQSAAAGANLAFDAVDATPYDALGFGLFRQGQRRSWYDVMYDPASPSRTRVFDYWYETTRVDSEGHQQRDKTYHTCCVFEVDAMCPRLHISRENLFTRIADHIGMPDIDFESEEFNHAFNVKSDDKKFASAVVDALMMQWLLTDDVKASFELNGTWGLLVSHIVKPREMPGIYSLGDQFRQHIPAVAMSLYPVTHPEHP